MDQVRAIKSFIAQYTSLWRHLDESKQPIELSGVWSSYQKCCLSLTGLQCFRRPAPRQEYDHQHCCCWLVAEKINSMLPQVECGQFGQGSNRAGDLCDFKDIFVPYWSPTGGAVKGVIPPHISLFISPPPSESPFYLI